MCKIQPTLSLLHNSCQKIVEKLRPVSFVLKEHIMTHLLFFNNGVSGIQVIRKVNEYETTAIQRMQSISF